MRATRDGVTAIITVMTTVWMTASTETTPPNISMGHFIDPSVTSSFTYSHPTSQKSPTSSEQIEEEKYPLSEEKRLTQDLLMRYERAGRGGRPVFNTTTPTPVEFGLGLIQMDLDERNKILMTSMWTRLKWVDMYLTWEPGDYGGVQTVRLESESLWIPDIMLYNTADPEGAARNALVIVFFDGTVQWVPHQIFRSSCSIDASNFPFDRQQCHMWFGSWTHSRSDIELNLAFNGGIDLSTFQSDYKDSCEWDIVHPLAEKRLLPENDPNPICVLSFTLNLQRKLVFSSYILTLPCIFLASLTLVVFWLPPERPDRTALAMSLFSSFLVLLLILVEAAPPTASSVPLLGVYYCFNMVIIMLSIFLSTTVVNIHRSGDGKKLAPRWMKIMILHGLGRMMCMCTHVACCCKDCGKTQKRDSTDAEPTVVDHRRTNDGKCRMIDGEEQSWSRLLNNSNTTEYSNVRDFSTDPCGGTGTLLNGILEGKYKPFYMQLEDIKLCLQQVVKNNREKDEITEHARIIIQEWREMARVLDRLFFMLYIGFIIVGFVSFFPKPLLEYQPSTDDSGTAANNLTG